jgi:hypothetical protein
MAIITLNNNSLSSVTALPAADGSSLTGVESISEIDMWVPTVDATNFTVAGVNSTSSDLFMARHTGSNFTKKGTGMSTNNSYWSFPSTGYWYVSLKAQWRLESTQSARGLACRIDVSTDGGSSYNDNYALDQNAVNSASTSSDYCSTDANCVVEVNNISIVKVRGFYISTNANTNLDVAHDDPDQSCGWTFIKLRGM